MSKELKKAGKTAIISANETMSLFKLTNEIMYIDELLQESGGEITEEVGKHIDKITSDFSKKVDSVGGYDRYLKSLVQIAKDESKRFSNIAKSLENRRVGFGNYVLACMKAMKETNVSGMSMTAYIRKNPTKVTIDMDLLPDEFKKDEVKRVADKEKINKHEKPAEIKGVTITDSETVVFLKKGKNKKD